MEWLQFLAGGLLGFLASLAATYLWGVVTAPNLTVQEAFPIDARYYTATAPNGAEVRVDRPTAGATVRAVSFYTVSIRNSPLNDGLRQRLPRDMAWATRAFMEYAQFIPGQNQPMSNGRRFSYYGRWAGTEEPITPSPPAIRKGGRVNIPHNSEEALNIALKVNGDNSAWGFTNDSYHYAQKGNGLWRHPAFEIPLGDHFRVKTTIDCPGSSATLYHHVVNTGAGIHDVVIHTWGTCPDCAALDETRL